MLNNQKVQIQREFEAFKDMATQVRQGHSNTGQN
jgi:hypothetical protein